MPDEAVIYVKELTKEYGNMVAVDNISFTVNRGEIFAFLGPNGAGKTTTIEILQCLRHPTSGRAKVLGFDVVNPREAQEIKKSIGVLPQDFSALDKLTVRENVAMFAAMYNRSRDPDELIKLMKLEDKTNTRFDKLSGGLRQRVGIAVALANDPELVFLDEPTTGLDPESRRGVWKIVQRMKDEGRTVFLTTHYMEEAERLADRIAIINKGRIVANGTTKELLEKHGGGRFLLVEDVPPAQLEEVRKAIPGSRYSNDNDNDNDNNNNNDNNKNNNMIIHIKDFKEVGRAIEVLGRFGLTERLGIHNPTIENVFLHLVGARLTEEGELA